FAKSLANLGEVYVNDAFGAAHRKHSSTYTITQFFPRTSAMGFLMKKECTFFQTLLSHPQKPFYAVLGGANISSKIKVLKALLHKVDAFFIGGVMAYTFLKARGIEIGDSIYEESLLSTAQQFLKESEKKNIPIHHPLDLLIADEFKTEANKKQ